MLVRPRSSRQSSSSHSTATGCLTDSVESHEYTKTLVSTKTAAVIQLFARGIAFAGAFELHRHHGEKQTSCALVLACTPHVLLQHLADEPRKAHTLLGRVLS